MDRTTGQNVEGSIAVSMKVSMLRVVCRTPLVVLCSSRVGMAVRVTAGVGWVWAQMNAALSISGSCDPLPMTLTLNHPDDEVRTALTLMLTAVASLTNAYSCDTITMGGGAGAGSACEHNC